MSLIVFDFDGVLRLGNDKQMTEFAKEILPKLAELHRVCLCSYNPGAWEIVVKNNVQQYFTDYKLSDRYIAPDDELPGSFIPKSQHILDWIALYRPSRTVFFDDVLTNVKEVQLRIPDCCCVLVNPVTGITQNNLFSASL